MSTFQRISAEADGAVTTVTLRAGKGNVIDKAMMHEIAAAVEIAGSNPQGKAILFCAEGDHFSFGASVPEHRAEVVAEMLTAFHALFRTLIASSLPTVSAVRGQCLGGGFELVAFTHWVFASPDACFGQPEVNLGVFPPVASLILPFRVGQTAADDLTLTGRSWAAEELKQKGFLHAVTDRPEEAAREFIQKHLVPKSAVALRYTVRSSRWAMHEAVLKHISALEKMYIDELMKSHDANEGIKAFMEKRPPIWKNQ